MGGAAEFAALFGIAGSAKAATDVWFRGRSEGAVERMRAAFPYPIVTVKGADALAEWQRLKAEGEGWPVIIGNDQDLDDIMAQFSSDDTDVFPPPPDLEWELPKERTVEQILSAANEIDIDAKLIEAFGEQFGDFNIDVETGEWPARGEVPPTTLTVDRDVLTDRVFPQVHIVIVPTRDSAEVPAFLRWGGWNACPMPEVHVALHRKWAKAYGTEMVGISSAVINMRAGRRPKTRKEALALAAEQYVYCSDIVLQGTGTLERLASPLMESDWWYFWWD